MSKGVRACPPQEFRDFDGETQSAGGAQRLAQATATGAVEGRRMRHRLWLQRRPAAEWRLAKRSRLAAYHWGEALDHMLQVGAGASLQVFQQPLAEETRQPALQWHKLSVAMDLGSDGVAFMNFVRMHKQCNIELVPDTSHGVHNGVDEALAACGLRGHMFLLMMAMNTPHGPWSEDQRFVQCRNVVSGVFGFENHQQNVLFHELFSSILVDRDESWRLGEEGLELEVWGSLESASPFAKKGKKVNTSRFMGIHHEGWAFVRSWHSRFWTQTHLCIEMNWLRAKHFGGLKPAKLDNEADMDAAMKSSAASAAKALRQSAGNALVATTLWMSDGDNYWRTRTILKTCQAWEFWHSQQNSRLRCLRVGLTISACSKLDEGVSRDSQEMCPKTLGRMECDRGVSWREGALGERRPSVLDETVRRLLPREVSRLPNTRIRF